MSPFAVQRCEEESQKNQGKNKQQLSPAAKSTDFSGGYRIFTPIQLGNVLGAINTREITFQALRVYLGCFELTAIREAARRSNGAFRRASWKNDKKRYVRYQIKELHRITGLSERVIKRELKNLALKKLLTFSESQIVITETPLPYAKDVLEELSGKRKATRPIPLPRRLIRFLAGNKKASLVLTALGYAVRGLTFDKKTKEVRGVGRAKASWISDVFGLSERAVHYARAELIKLGFITKDEQPNQRRLNGYGAYFSINLNWNGSKEESREENKNESAEEKSSVELVGARDKKGAEFAPPRVGKCTDFAPPIYKLLTPYGLKDQKLIEGEPTGLLKNISENHHSKISIRDIKLEDLKLVTTLMVLYEQAIRARWLEPSEANLVNFVAAAVRATRTSWGEPVRIFVSIVKKKLWHHITHEQEDRAVQAIKRYRAQKPQGSSCREGDEGEEKGQGSERAKVQELVQSLAFGMKKIGKVKAWEMVA